MTLPILLSVPHAGLRVPAEVEGNVQLTPQQISEDGDGGAGEIYALKDEVAAFVTTDIARAFVDMNRAVGDIRKDGIIKTHTCWDVPIYRTPLSEELAAGLIRSYHQPYHRRLTTAAAGVRFGVDCHTMAAQGPPVGPDPGKTRPELCLSDAEGTCPKPWFEAFVLCLEKAFGLPVSRNVPFTGGYIIRAHGRELPWVQLEMSRAEFLSLEKKRQCFLQAVARWCDMKLWEQGWG